jgi:hypothetical protein
MYPVKQQNIATYILMNKKYMLFMKLENKCKYYYFNIK